MSGILLSRLKKINPKPLVRKDVNQPSLYRSTSQKNWWPQESLQAEVKTGRLVQSQFKEQLESRFLSSLCTAGKLSTTPSHHQDKKN